MRRGLTMIELMAAVGLLSALTVAVASWLQVTVRTARDQTQPAQWRSSGAAVMQLIQDDLLIGDFDSRDSARRVVIENGILTLRTRSATESRGTVTHRYRFDAAAATLRRERTDDAARRSDRLLLDDLAEWEPTLDPDRNELEVTAISTAGLRLTRRYALR